MNSLQLRARQLARTRTFFAERKILEVDCPLLTTGVVVDTLFREGEWVSAGAPVVRMLPPENVKVRFFVPQPDLGLVPIGQNVTIRCDGCASVTAKVSYVSPEPEYTPPIIYSSETRAKLVFMVEAHPEPKDGASLRPGQPVEVVVQ